MYAMDNQNTLKLCRLCLCKGEVYKDIFEQEERLSTVAEVIVDLLRFEVTEEDVYSKFVCLQCFDKLSEFKQFKEQCVESKDTFEKDFLPLLHSPHDQCSGENLDHMYEVKIEKIDVSEEDGVSIHEREEYMEDKEGLNGEISRRDAHTEDAVEEESSALTYGLKTEKVDADEGDEWQSSVEADYGETANQDSKTYSEEHEEILCEVKTETVDHDEGDGASGHEWEEAVDEEGNGELTRQDAQTDKSREENYPNSMYVVKTEEIDIDEGKEGELCEREESLEERNGCLAHREDVHSDRGFEMAERLPHQRFNQGFREMIYPMNNKNYTAMTSTITNKWNNISFRCHRCNRGFETKDEISEHLRICFPGDHGTSFFDGPSVSYSYLAHNRTHLSGDIQEIDYHNRRNLYRPENNLYYRSPDEEGNVYADTQSGLVQNYNSQLCDISRKELMVHVKQMHSNRRHVLSQSADFENRCDICLKTFNKKGNLQRHMLTHTGERPNRCNLCSRAFTQRGNLERHMLTHTGEKPHKCEICSKAFTQSGCLKDHMLTHTGERPYTCNTCSKTFTTRGNLQIHILTHTGERSHRCNICLRAFSHKSNLNTHMSVHNRRDRMQNNLQIC